MSKKEEDINPYADLDDSQQTNPSYPEVQPFINPYQQQQIYKNPSPQQQPYLYNTLYPQNQSVYQASSNSYTQQSYNPQQYQYSG